MERGEIRCLLKHDVRGIHLLDDEGMPLVSIQALRVNLDQEPCNIEVVVELDRRGNQRNLTGNDYDKLKPHVVTAITELKSFVGDLPLSFRKHGNGSTSEMAQNWVE